MAPAGTMTMEFGEETRAAIASAENVIKGYDARLLWIERRLAELLAATPDAALDLSEGIGDQAAHIRALGDRMTALERMLTGYVSDLNALAERHSAYMMETRAMVADLTKRHEERRDVVNARFNEVWAKVAPEIYEGLPADVTAPIGAIIEGMRERVDALEAKPRIPSPAWVREVADVVWGNADMCKPGVVERVDAVEEQVNNQGRHLNERINAIQTIRDMNLDDLRASVKALGEDITAVGDRLDDHLNGEDAPGCDRDPGDEASAPPQATMFDHDYFAERVEKIVAEHGAQLVKRITKAARGADADGVPF